MIVWPACAMLVMAALFTLLPEVESASTYRMCGQHLADFLALVCKNRGYNSPPMYHRTKRASGIVEECCKSSCSLKVWEQYCAESERPSTTQLAAPTEETSNHINIDSTENLIRKKIRDFQNQSPPRVFRIGTIAPYYESNHIISPIDDSDLFVQSF